MEGGESGYDGLKCRRKEADSHGGVRMRMLSGSSVEGTRVESP